MFQLLVMEQVAWNSGETRLWDFLLAYLVVGALLNGIQLVLHLSIPELAKQPVGPIIIWLAAEDFLFDFICTIQCSLNRHHHEFYGHETACRIQSFYGSFLMLMSCATIVSLLYATYSAIVHNRFPDMARITKIHLALSVYCLVLTLLGNFWPGTHHLVPSGIYCYANLGTQNTAVIFHVFFFLPAFGALFYFYASIYKRIQHMTLYLTSRGIQVGARPAQMRLVKLLSIYIAGVGLCFSLIEAGGIYGWITQANGPSGLFFAGGFMGHFLTFISPLLYYAISSRSREIVIRRLRGRHRSASPPSSLVREHDSRLYQRPVLLGLLQDRESNMTLLDFATQQFAPECILFWNAVQKWHQRWTSTPRSSIHTARTSTPSSPQISPSLSPRHLDSNPEPMVELLPPTLMSERKRETEGKGESEDGDEAATLRRQAQDIHDLFLSDSAPLQINLPAEVRLTLVKKLNMQNDGSCHMIMGPLAATVFDAAEDETVTLILCDLYPRFLVRHPGVVDPIEQSLRAIEPIVQGNLFPLVDSPSTVVSPDVSQQGEVAEDWSVS